MRIFIASEATDMRRSFDRLVEMARSVVGQDPLAGHFFVFFNRPRDRVKSLVWERGGHTLRADQRACPVCGETMQPFGEETSEQLASIPARIFVKQHARIKYACKKCECVH